MDIMELGAIGELVGGVAVIGSLIYVGLQVRQSTEQARQRNAIERAQAVREVTRDYNDLALVLTDAELMQLLRQAMADFEALSRNDQARIHHWLATRVIHSISLFLSGRDGLIDERYVETWLNGLAAWIKMPGLSRWWTQAKPLLHPAFVMELDHLIEATDGPPPISEVFTWFLPDDAAKGA